MSNLATKALDNTTASAPSTAADTSSASSPSTSTSTSPPQALVDPVASAAAQYRLNALEGDVTVSESQRRIQRLQQAIEAKLAEHEKARVADLDHLRYLISSNSMRSSVYLAKIERKDVESFEEVRELMRQATAESLQLLQDGAASLNAKLADRYLRGLTAQIQSVQEYLDSKYTEELRATVRQATAKQAEQFDTDLLELSSQHLATLTAMSSQYATAFSNLMEHVDNLSNILDTQRNLRHYADFAQRLSVAVVSLERSVDSGQPLGQPWNTLKGMCKDDQTISAALSVVPEVVVRRGAAPMEHLRERFSRVHSSALTGTYVAPSNSFLSHIGARIFGAITLKESSLAPVPPSATSSEQVPTAVNDVFAENLAHDHARLARAAYHLDQSDLSGVVDELNRLRMPHAKTAAQGFLTEVRDRVVLEQALQVLRAHSSALFVDVSLE